MCMDMSLFGAHEAEEMAQWVRVLAVLVHKDLSLIPQHQRNLQHQNPLLQKKVKRQSRTPDIFHI